MMAVGTILVGDNVGQVAELVQMVVTQT